MDTVAAGAPLQLSKRQWMVPLLYVLSWLWLLQFIFTGMLGDPQLKMKQSFLLDHWQGWHQRRDVYARFDHALRS